MFLLGVIEVSFYLIFFLVWYGAIVLSYACNGFADTVMVMDMVVAVSSGDGM